MDMQRTWWTKSLVCRSLLALAAVGCDGGEVDVDASMPGPDTGVDESDGATPDPDSGTTDPDGGVTEDGAMPDPDGGVPEPDAGPPVLSCAMGSIRIEETCPAFARCGGDPVGSWCYADVCMTKDELLEPVLMQPGVPAECTADMVQVRGSMGMIDGTVDVTATTITRMVMSSATGTFYLPPACTIVNCRVTEAAINSALGADGSATCMTDGPGCECDITFNSMVDSSDPYSLEGNTIVTDAGRRFDYCIESDGNFRFKEDASMRSGSGEPGTQTVLPLSP